MREYNEEEKVLFIFLVWFIFLVKGVLEVLSIYT